MPPAASSPQLRRAYRFSSKAAIPGVRLSVPLSGGRSIAMPHTSGEITWFSSHVPVTSTLHCILSASPGEPPDRAVHGIAQSLLARIVEDEVVHVVHHVGEAEPCI